MNQLLRDPPALDPFEVKDSKGNREGISPSWYTWLIGVTRTINRQGSRKPPYPQITTLTPSGSPWVYQDNVAGDSRVLISGGTVSKIEISWDNSTYYNTGLMSGQIILSQSDYLRITYATAPTVVTIPA